MERLRPTPQDKVALVTGAATRVGRSIALELSDAGYRVAIHYHGNASGAREVLELIEARGHLAHSYRADLSSRSEVRALVDRVVYDFGCLDLLVPNAAIFERIAFDSIDDAAWDRMLELNLTSSFTLAHHAAPILRNQRGSIVFITCSSVVSPYRHHLPYVVSKAGLYQTMRTMALELAPEVRVNAVAPGTVLPPADLPSHELENLLQRIPLGRFGCPEDVAKAVRFLAESPFITGQQLVVDGGRSLGLLSDSG